MMLLERLFETGAPAQRQDGLRKKVLLIFGTHPAQAIGGESASWDHTVDMRMKAQIPGPSLQDSKQAKFRPEVFMFSSDIL